MTVCISDEMLHGIRDALLGHGSDELMQVIFRLNLGQSLDELSQVAVARAIALGWVSDRGNELTQFGQLVADPIREYLFWLDRGRTIHAETLYPMLAASGYRGKKVLEPGSGFGANLFSLSLAGADCVGVEPTRIFKEFSPIFAEREGLPVPKIVEGTAEALPFEDDEFDFVIVYSAHQYMDIRVAINEMARVLRPGGQLRIMGTAFGTYAIGAFRDIFARRRWRSIKSFSLTVVNTIGYEAFGHRIYVPKGPFSTISPIYPRYPFMVRCMKEAGLVPRNDLTRRVGMGTAMFADRKK